METQKTSNSQTILRKKNRTRGIISLNLDYTKKLQSSKQYDIGTKSDTQIRIENPEINPHIGSQMVLEKGARSTQWGKDSLFNKWCWENWISTAKEYRLETIKLPGENKGKKPHNISLRNDFLDMIPKAQAIKAKTDKWDLIKLKSFCNQ